MIDRSHLGRFEVFLTPEDSDDPPPPTVEDAAVELITSEEIDENEIRVKSPLHQKLSDDSDKKRLRNQMGIDRGEEC